MALPQPPLGKGYSRFLSTRSSSGPRTTTFAPVELLAKAAATRSTNHS